MKRFLLSIILTVTLVCEAAAIDLFKKGSSDAFDYTSWCDTTALARVTDDGQTLFYPTTESESAVIDGKISIPGQSAEHIFIAALDYAVNHLDPDKDHEMIGELNETNKSFMLRLYSKQGSNNTESVFSRLMLIKAENEQLLFRVSEIDVKYREKGILPRTLPFEKLNPAINTRHRELVELFAQINAAYIHGIKDAIGKSDSMKITHWDDIRNKEVVKGMNGLEVKLILGLPVTTRATGERTRWVYPNNLVILFENDIVTRIVD